MTGTDVEYDQLRELLISPEVAALHALGEEINDLRHQLETPELAARLLGPVAARVLSSGNPELSQALISAITPFLDEAVRERIAQDADAMTAALAPATTGAIALHYAKSPESALKDMAPIVGASVKEQLKGEREAMIDALYPIMGRTIARYISHALTALVQKINEQIETRFSFKSLTRKIRARALGISETDLILRESITWGINAAFLIHSRSGLVIAQAQKPGGPALDSDLLSGMLTAIRTLFNDSLKDDQEPRQLDQIEYGDMKIILEVAGSSYLAAVVHGVPGEGLRKVLHAVMTRIIEESDHSLEQFDGDTDAVPEPVTQTVESLVMASGDQAQHGRKRHSYGALVVALLLLLALGIPLVIHMQRDARDRALEEKIRMSLAAAQPTPLTGVSVQADRGVVRLEGSTVNELQRTRAESIARASLQDGLVENHIIHEPDPPFGVFTALRADEVAAILNRVNGVFLEAHEARGELVVSGWIADEGLRSKTDAAFDGIPGIRTYKNTSVVGEPVLPVLLHFDMGSAVVHPAERGQIAAVHNYLNRFPSAGLLIVGHSDMTGGEKINRLLAGARASAAERELVALGVAPTRIRTERMVGPIQGARKSDADSLGRYVRFLLVHTGDALQP